MQLSQKKIAIHTYCMHVEGLEKLVFFLSK